jgi:hypothetical protein
MPIHNTAIWVQAEGTYLVPAVVVDEVFRDPVLHLYLKVSMLKLKNIIIIKKIKQQLIFIAFNGKTADPYVYSIYCTFE